jgi:hypothetical protein
MGMGLGEADPVKPEPISSLARVFNVFNAVICKAEKANIFQGLSRWGIKHQLSIYADVVAMFIKPVETELPNTFWAEALNHVMYVLSMFPSVSLVGNIP